MSEKGYRYSRNVEEAFERRVDPIWDLERGSAEFLKALGDNEEALSPYECHTPAEVRFTR